ncbi:MAG TPA: hypothetical protein PK691_12925, partial [Thermomicrobiales bacterium]|nr:hypothetical protein [Thermomicrobiales bacterium]
MIFSQADRIAALTPLYTGERFDDGRPRVPDDIVERMRLVTNDEAWGVMERGHEYHYQFEGSLLNMHPERVMVGRAVTARYIPQRPDVHGATMEAGTSEGRSGGQNTWIIDTLQPGDVLVVDLFGKIKDGTFVGDNLS